MLYNKQLRLKLNWDEDLLPSQMRQRPLVVGIHQTQFNNRYHIFWLPVSIGLENVSICSVAGRQCFLVIIHARAPYIAFWLIAFHQKCIIFFYHKFYKKCNYFLGSSVYFLLFLFNLLCHFHFYCVYHRVFFKS